MLPYSAYLRVYEPVTAYPEPLRSIWTAYAESGRRPRWARTLAAEHGEAIRRLASAPPVVAPLTESPHAYVRRAAGALYVCPWETRLRSWLAAADFLRSLPPGLAEAFVPPPDAERVTAELERWRSGGRSLEPHIATSTWNVPLEWFVPFDPAERCLLLGGQDDQTGTPPSYDPGEPRGPAGTWVAGAAGGQGDAGGPGGPTMAAPLRTLIYVTTLGEARRRLDRAVPVVQAGPPGGPAAGRLEALTRRLSAFHPSSLVELDYGGLVHLLDDEWLRADESVREVTVALAAAERGERELTVAMYQRLGTRWRAVRALESAN
ncbi:hypothetical protein [Thermomonospora umbrina]|uniref:hypothetical protein n=1 Tax=Thermomonospora umbrina TaxID=111806 RepID=UPI000E265DA1|nr:hypothetical protein [Thermomonospora umbrina]